MLLLSHTEWRKLAKKARRRRIRQEIATFRKSVNDAEQKSREESALYQQWLEEQRKLEEFQATEEARLAKEAEEKYLEREKEAARQWEELQKKLALAKEERARQIAKIKEEWDREQKKLKQLKDEQERKEEEKHQQQQLLQQRIEEFVNSNGEMPDELETTLESNPGKMTCPFFKKTAACRFKDTCSRNHIRPTISQVLLFRNFYSHYSLEQTTENEHGSDSILEFEMHEIYNDFKEFFHDIVREFEAHGELRQLKVCCNRVPHLRGNVYVEYGSPREAIKSYRVFQGRWYGGKQLNVEFCSIESWKSAICGLFFRKKCPKGSGCNFLHVFRNPGNQFVNADRDLHRPPPPINIEGLNSNSREWRWSESPERLPRTDEQRDRRPRHKHRSSSNSRRKRARSREKSFSERRNGHARHRSRSSERRHHSSRRSRSKSDRRLKSSSRERSNSHKNWD